MNRRLKFYSDTLSRWIPDRQSSILVVAGGMNDRDVLSQLGFKNIVVSNVSSAMNAADMVPFQWSRQDVEALSFDDTKFDYVMIHAGLHHCRLPHRGLLEMYRVAAKAVIAFEPPDNFVVRIMMRLGFAQTYENAVGCNNDGKRGGVNNTLIPNFIYRFTEREIEKTVQSYSPIAKHKLSFAYSYDEPAPEYIGKKGIKYGVVRLLMPWYKLFRLFFLKQGNLFAFWIEKPKLSQDLLPWLVEKDGQAFVKTKGDGASVGVEL